MSGWVSKAADLVPADKYAYQPTKTVRAFGVLDPEGNRLTFGQPFE